MITDYLEQSYTLKPLSTACNCSGASIEQMLIEIKAELGDSKEYVLYLGPESIGAIKHIGQHFNILLVIDTSCKYGSHYLVDKATKTIVYSPGVY